MKVRVLSSAALCLKGRHACTGICTTYSCIFVGKSVYIKICVFKIWGIPSKLKWICLNWKTTHYIFYRYIHWKLTCTDMSCSKPLLRFYLQLPGDLLYTQGNVKTLRLGWLICLSIWLLGYLCKCKLYTPDFHKLKNLTINGLSKKISAIH